MLSPNRSTSVHNSAASSSMATPPSTLASPTSEDASFKSAMDDAMTNGLVRHRTRLPVPQPDKTNVNLWSYLKSCIGKELTKITMPVAWNEPLSLLQRLSEYMNYSRLLKSGAQLTNAEDRTLNIAAFAVSALASNLERMGKPFNPLLGETYELQREDFRLVCEQVGHHPPVSAFHAENPDGDFVFHASVYPKVKFWGKSVEFQPKGTLTVVYPRWKETYTWTNVNCVVHNIIVGSLWMEHCGTMEIVNHATKHKCVLNFKQGGWFSGSNDLHTVEGFLLDRNKRKLRFVYGKWTEFLCSVDLGSMERYLKCNADKINDDASNLPKHEPLTLDCIPDSTILWRVDPRPDDSARYYNFSSFAMGLNEEVADRLCPTDCRLRPDIRALENGLLDDAAFEKDRLENKQREYRKPFKSRKEQDWWTPRWFVQGKHDVTKEDDWKFVGGYWERDFDNVPSIF